MVGKNQFHGLAFWKRYIVTDTFFKLNDHVYVYVICVLFFFQIMVDVVEVAKSPKFLVTIILARTLIVCKTSTLMRAAQGVSVPAV